MKIVSLAITEIVEYHISIEVPDTSEETIDAAVRAYLGNDGPGWDAHIGGTVDQRTWEVNDVEEAP